MKAETFTYRVIEMRAQARVGKFDRKGNLVEARWQPPAEFYHPFDERVEGLVEQLEAAGFEEILGGPEG